MDGPAPAILNAVEDAMGVRFRSIPLLPEDLFEGLRPESLEQEAPSSARGTV
jgi:CO/xanthine dehydrogenase Mo-binding subunit